MPAERPQGIGPLYVSYPQFASQNCKFSRPQWKSPDPGSLFSATSACPERLLRRARLPLRPPRQVPSFFHQKTKRHSQSCAAHLLPVICSLLSVIGPLKLHSPKISRRPIQLQPELPTFPPLMPPPDQRRIRRFPVHAIHNPQFLPDWQPLFHNGHASLRTYVHSVCLRLQRLTAFFPFHNQFHARIQAHPRSNMLPARLFRQCINPGHSRLPLLNALRKPAARQRKYPISSQQTQTFATIQPMHPSLLRQWNFPRRLPNQ